MQPATPGLVASVGSPGGLPFEPPRVRLSAVMARKVGSGGARKPLWLPLAPFWRQGSHWTAAHHICPTDAVHGANVAVIFMHDFSALFDNILVTRGLRSYLYNQNGLQKVPQMDHDFATHIASGGSPMATSSWISGTSQNFAMIKCRSSSDHPTTPQPAHRPPQPRQTPAHPAPKPTTPHQHHTNNPQTPFFASAETHQKPVLPGCVR